MLLHMLYHFGVEEVLNGFLRGHVLGMLLFLFLGCLMNHELDLCTLIEEFGSEEKCRHYLERLRWPKGILCPACGSDKISRIAARNQFDCDNCRYQFSATAGTIFHDTHLPLWKWFLATCLLCESRKGMFANQLKRMLKVTYKTAWYLFHRIRAAMMETSPKKLHGTVEIDETYVGGKPRKHRTRPDKQVVIGIRQRNGDLRLIHAEDAKSDTVRQIINANIGGHVEVIITDEAAIYPFALSSMRGKEHKTINHSREYVHGDIHKEYRRICIFSAQARCHGHMA